MAAHTGQGRLALIAGRGALPDAVFAALQSTRGQPPVICALRGSLPDTLPVDKTFRLEQLGSLLRWLHQQGVQELCLCGAVTRPPLQPWYLSLATVPMVPRILRALRRGDDGALRIAMDLLQEAGFRVLGAHEVAPDLLLHAGVVNGPLSEDAEALAALGDQVSQMQGDADLGQASVLRDGAVLARETDAGTDALLASLPAKSGHSGILFKVPKPGQDRRADLPTIGPETILGAARAGLAGIVIEADGVLVLDQQHVTERLQETGLFLWSRERSG